MPEKRLIRVLLLLLREVRVYLHCDLQVCVAHEILGRFHVHARIVEHGAEGVAQAVHIRMDAQLVAERRPVPFVGALGDRQTARAGADEAFLGQRFDYWAQRRQDRYGPLSSC